MKYKDYSDDKLKQELNQITLFLEKARLEVNYRIGLTIKSELEKEIDLRKTKNLTEEK